MYKSPYSFQQHSITRYIFTSVGRARIKKVVDFEKLSVENTFNLGFGDVKSDGSIDDKANSNNGDLVKVLATVITIVKDFTMKNPNTYIIFSSSTEERMKLYTRILRSNFSAFRHEFAISGFVLSGGEYKEVSFDPNLMIEYSIFLIKRIN